MTITKIIKKSNILNYTKTLILSWGITFSLLERIQASDDDYFYSYHHGQNKPKSMDFDSFIADYENNDKSIHRDADYFSTWMKSKGKNLSLEQQKKLVLAILKKKDEINYTTFIFNISNEDLINLLEDIMDNQIFDKNVEGKEKGKPNFFIKKLTEAFGLYPSSEVADFVTYCLERVVLEDFEIEEFIGLLYFKPFSFDEKHHVNLSSGKILSETAKKKNKKWVLELLTYNKKLGYRLRLKLEDNNAPDKILYEILLNVTTEEKEDTQSAAILIVEHCEKAKTKIDLTTDKGKQVVIKAIEHKLDSFLYTLLKISKKLLMTDDSIDSLINYMSIQHMKVENSSLLSRISYCSQTAMGSGADFIKKGLISVIKNYKEVALVNKNPFKTLVRGASVLADESVEVNLNDEDIHKALTEKYQALSAENIKYIIDYQPDEKAKKINLKKSDLGNKLLGRAMNNDEKDLFFLLVNGNELPDEHKIDYSKIPKKDLTKYISYMKLKNKDNEFEDAIKELTCYTYDILEKGKKLINASMNGRVDEVKCLLEESKAMKRSIVNEKDSDHKTALRHAVDRGHIEVVRNLLHQKDINPNIMAKDQNYPLLVSVKHPSILELFTLQLYDLNSKYKVDFRVSYKGKAVLGLIVKRITELSDKNLKQKQEIEKLKEVLNLALTESLFYLCSKEDKKEAEDFLSKHKSDNDDDSHANSVEETTDNDDDDNDSDANSVEETTDNDDDDNDSNANSVEETTDNDDDDNDSDSNSVEETTDNDDDVKKGKALIDASKEGNLSRVENLLQESSKMNGTIVNTKDSAGKTALRHAVDEGHDKVVERLLKEGDIVPNIEAKDQNYPLLVSVKHPSILAMLVNHNKVELDVQYGEKTLLDVIVERITELKTQETKGLDQKKEIEELKEILGDLLANKANQFSIQAKKKAEDFMKKIKNFEKNDKPKSSEVETGNHDETKSSGVETGNHDEKKSRREEVYNDDDLDEPVQDNPDAWLKYIKKLLKLGKLEAKNLPWVGYCILYYSRSFEKFMEYVAKTYPKQVNINMPFKSKPFDGSSILSSIPTLQVDDSSANNEFKVAPQLKKGYTNLLLGAFYSAQNMKVLLKESKKMDIKINVNIQDSDGKTPLRTAVDWDSGKVVEMLLKEDYIDPNIVAKDQNYPLLESVKYNYILRMFVNHDRVKLDVTDGKENTLLHLLVKRIDAIKGDDDSKKEKKQQLKEIVAKLVQDQKINPSLTNSDGKKAADLTEDESLKALLKSKKIAGFFGEKVIKIILLVVLIGGGLAGVGYFLLKFLRKRKNKVEKTMLVL